MFTSNGREGEAKRLFAYLELNNENVVNLDIFIFLILFKHLVINSFKNRLMPEHLPLFGGIFLTAISLILELIEFVGESLFYLLEVFLQLSLIENGNK